MNNCICKININGTEYAIKDSEARNLISTLQEQLTATNTSVTEVNNKYTNISSTINEHIENAFKVQNESLILGGE